MQRYHLEVEGIPEYINILEDAQRQASRAGRTIADETLLLFASTSMLTSERFPRANDDWEEHTERDKKWSQWKTTYKRDHAKARVKRETTQFVLAFVADTWVRELRDSDSLYNEVGLKELFSHLQAGCTG